MALADFCKVFDRITAKVVVDEDTDCYVWTGAVNSRGYPCFGLRGKVVTVRIGGTCPAPDGRVDIPEGHQVHHRCRNKRCVSVAHLEELSVLDHAHEHGYTPPPGGPQAAPCGVCGSLRKQKKDGRWDCPACHRKQNLAWKERRRLLG